MALDRRVEVLFEGDEHDRLQAQARTRGVSLAELIREAVRRQVLEPDATARREAARRLTSGELDLTPLPDWPAVEQELEAALRRDLEAH